MKRLMRVYWRWRLERAEDYGREVDREIRLLTSVRASLEVERERAQDRVRKWKRKLYFSLDNEVPPT